MNGDPQRTFSARRRWSARLAVVIATACVVAIVVMVNHASQRFFSGRWFLSSQTDVQLSPQTLGMLKGLTNEVEVTLFYDQDDMMYSTVEGLLKEYAKNSSHHIHVRKVDYLRNPAEAAAVKMEYNLPTVEGNEDKDLVIFRCENRTNIVPANLFVEYKLEQDPGAKELEFQKKPVLFRGEQTFSAVILAVTSPKRLKACFLQGHGEHLPEGGDDQRGYLKFSNLLRLNYLEVVPISLLTNQIPDDCNLLVIAGPTDEIPEVEVQKIGHYLDQGGRALVLFNYLSAAKSTGLESLLSEWGVVVGKGVVRDLDMSVTKTGQDLKVVDFGSHVIMNPLLNSALHLILPRPVGPASTNNQTADAPKVDVLAASRPEAEWIESVTKRRTGRFPLAVAVERGPVKGVVTERGSTRLVVVGDSFFLGNQMIESAGNRDFASAAINWLVDRPALLQGIGPKRVKDYDLVLTDLQMRRIEWLLLGALPAVVMIVGGLVWLRRRK